MDETCNCNRLQSRTGVGHVNEAKVKAGHSWKALVAAILCLGLLAGCDNISKQELQNLGSSLTRKDIDFANLETYAYRAKAAYTAEAAIRSAYPKTIRVASPGGSGVQYFIERDDAARRLYVTVRGTADKKNVSEDFDISVRTDRKTDIPVHAGFDKDARAVYADAKPYLKPGYRIAITGHSLGGAVAALVGIYAIEDGFTVERVVTFGQPRFTTAAGVSRLGFLPLTRVVDENDIIPMLPPAVGAAPYEHVGPEIILLEGPRYVYLPSHDANRLAIGEFWRSVGIADLRDHKIDKYVARIADKRGSAVEVSYNSREKYVAKGSTQQSSAASPN
jgi:triacylglycerol lipase